VPLSGLVWLLTAAGWGNPSLSVWTRVGWAELPALAGSLVWRESAAGVAWSEARLAASGEAWRTRLIIVRLDPARVHFRLDTATQSRGARADWSVDRAPREALVAVNAGQFSSSLPWGWTVLGGREYRAPGRGPLSVAVAFDSTGMVRWLTPGQLADPATRRGVAAGFQSYPLLLLEGEVPAALREAGRGVDLAHRDARVALGQTTDGAVLVALTRFDGAGGAFDFLPFGLTVPEMAEVMAALGARNAVLLDGGVSGQLLIREERRIVRWRGLRKVPLGLVAMPR